VAAGSFLARLGLPRRTGSGSLPGKGQTETVNGMAGSFFESRTRSAGLFSPVAGLPARNVESRTRLAGFRTRCVEFRTRHFRVPDPADPVPGSKHRPQGSARRIPDSENRALDLTFRAPDSAGCRRNGRPGPVQWGSLARHLMIGITDTPGPVTRAPVLEPAPAFLRCARSTAASAPAARPRRRPAARSS
jgi:hypothetical protein